MSTPSLSEIRAHASVLGMSGKRLLGWRLAVFATVTVGIATGLVLAWIWMDNGFFFFLIVIASPFVAACLFWLLFNDSGRRGAATEPSGTSEWEVRIRPHFPRDEHPVFDLKRRSERDEA